VLAPAATPKPIVASLSAALQKILAGKVVQQRFEALGVEARGSSPEQFTAFLKKEEARWSPIIKQANIKAE
jgi:tripartite-type tricarboxylate transporter receptor subunit TctC